MKKKNKNAAKHESNDELQSIDLAEIEKVLGGLSLGLDRKVLQPRRIVIASCDTHWQF